MANKRYDEFTAAAIDPAKIMLQANAATGELFKFTLSDLIQYIWSITGSDFYANGTGDLHLLNAYNRKIFGMADQCYINFHDNTTNALRFKNVNVNQVSIFDGGLNVLGQLYTANNFDLSPGKKLTSLSAFYEPYNAGNGSTIFRRAVVGSLAKFIFESDASIQQMIIDASGRMGISTVTPDSFLTLPAGLTTAGYSALKFAAGALLTVIENGAFEYNGTTLYFSSGGTRIDILNPTGTNQKFGDTPSGDVTASADRVFDINDKDFIQYLKAGSTASYFQLKGTPFQEKIEAQVDLGGGFYTFFQMSESDVQLIAQGLTASNTFRISGSSMILSRSTDGYVAIQVESHKTTLRSTKIRLPNIQNFASNADAITGGLAVGDLYRTGGAMMIVI